MLQRKEVCFSYAPGLIKPYSALFLMILRRAAVLCELAGLLYDRQVNHGRI